jgi:hypothetical protein
MASRETAGKIVVGVDGSGKVIGYERNVDTNCAKPASKPSAVGAELGRPAARAPCLPDRTRPGLRKRGKP